MDTRRIQLTILHTVLVIFAAISFHPLVLSDKKSDHRRRISQVIGFLDNVVCLCLYHAAAIVAVWYSRAGRFSASMVRAGGVLLIGELMQLMATVLQSVLTLEHVDSEHIGFSLLHHLLLLVATALTFRLAEKLAAHENDFTNVHFVVPSGNAMALDELGPEPEFL